MFFNYYFICCHLFLFQDETLIKRKGFSTNEDDWKWFSPAVPSALKKLHDDGYKLVIFSNQGGIKTAMLGAQSTKIRALIDNVLATLHEEAGDEIPVQVLLATANPKNEEDKNRKPQPGMWNFFVQNLNAGVSPGESP